MEDVKEYVKNNIELTKFEIEKYPILYLDSLIKGLIKNNPTTYKDLIRLSLKEGENNS